MRPSHRVPWHIPLAILAVVLVGAAIFAAASGTKKRASGGVPATVTTTTAPAVCTDDQEALILASVKASLETTEQDPALAISVACDATSIRLESQLFRKAENKPEGMGFCVLLQSAIAEAGVSASNAHLVVGTPDGGVIGSTDIKGFCQGRT